MSSSLYDGRAKLVKRDIYDGEPYFCATCGEPFEACGDDCRLESKEAALARASKRRKLVSDSVFQKPSEL